MKDMKVKLSLLEMILGSIVGIMRHLTAVNKGRKDNDSVGNSIFDFHITGAIYELAFANFLNVYFVPTMNSWKNPDVAGYQVRGTELNKGRLIFRPKDTKGEPYVLVTGGNKFTYCIRGWIMGTDIVKNDEWLSNPHGLGKCWMVPQYNLNKEFVDVNKKFRKIDTWWVK